MSFKGNNALKVLGWSMTVDLELQKEWHWSIDSANL